MKRNTLLGIIVFTLFAGVAWAEDPVYFADAKLKALVETKLGVTDPTPTDMLDLTSLFAFGEGITSLTGLETATNLTRLYVSGNAISGLSPLSGLADLEELEVGGNEISTIGSLSGLTNLRRLGIGSNQISSLSALSGLTNLETLSIGSNPIGSLSALSGLSNLTSLTAYYCDLTSVAPLSSLTDLELLELQGNQIDNLAPLGGLDRLTSLSLASNQISDISALSSLTQLRYLALGGNEITGIGPLMGLTNLTSLYLSGNPLSQSFYCTDLPSLCSSNPDLVPGDSLSYSANDYPPSNVSASDGTYSHKVEVTWSAVCDAMYEPYYCVYRSESIGGSRTPVAGYLTAWRHATSLEDTHAAPGVTYYYWVKAKTADSSGNYYEMDYSLSDTGWCGSGTTTYSLNASSTAGGSVTAPGEGSFSYAPGTSVSIVATADSDYEFSGWSGTAVSAGKVANASATSTTVTMDADYTLVANFSPTTSTSHTLSVSSGAGGAVTSPGEGAFSYAPGTSVPIVATADSDYEFSGWTGTAVSAGKVANAGVTSTTVAMDGNYTLVANFSPTTTTTVTLNVSSGEGGSVSAPGEGAFSYAPSTSVSIEATVEMGYGFAGWSGTAVSAGRVANASSASTTVTMDGNYTLVANFTLVAPSTYTLSVSSGAGGSVTTPGEGTFTCEPGTTVSVHAVAESGYSFTGWSGTAVGAGKVSSPAAASTSVTVDADYTLVAGFVGDTVVLTLSSTTGGCVTTPGEGTFSYNYEETVTLEAEAAPGYYFVEWSGSFNTSSNPTVIEMDADHQVTANFALNPPVLTVSSGAGGGVVVPGEGTFVHEHGDAVRAVALPDAGYVFAGWTGTIFETGVLADRNVARVDFIVEEDASLHANFAPVVRCLYVDDDAPSDPLPGNSAVSDPAEDGSWDHPFDAIQEAIETATDSDTVLVLAGTYRENIAFRGKSIMVSAFDLTEVGAISQTTLVDADADSVVVFEAGESAGSILVGFTIAGGGGELGGGIRCSGADPIIAHCLITGNRADLGGGVYCQDSRATLANCTIADNFSWLEGGGLHCDDEVTVINSIFSGNRPEQIVADPCQAPGVIYSAVRGGWPGAGNFDGDPYFVEQGHWSLPDDTEVSVNPNDPEATWISGDYHLKAREGHWSGWMWLNDGVTSRCVDAGNPDADVKWEPLPNGSRLNMGAFGGTAEASQSDLPN